RCRSSCSRGPRSSLDPTLVLQSLVSGLLFGGVYSLMAVGLTLIFGVMRVVNFAHGDMMVWGMYVTFLLASRAGVDPYVAFGAAAAALFVLGLAVQRGLVDRVLDAPHEMQLLLMLGVAPILPWEPATGLSLSVASFNIVIIGGMGSLLGAFVGGLLVSVAESLGAVFLQPSLKELASFSLLILILLFRPAGLFGNGRDG